MTRAAWLKMFAAFVVSSALTCIPNSSFAQRGGGGFHSGGGFHGGGFGGAGFHGGGFRGGNFGGFHGNGFSGLHNGFGAFHNGFGRFHGHGFGDFDDFWFPGWGWGWGFDIGFGVGWPYWGYPYYAWSPGWGTYGYSYPYYDPYPDYRYHPPDPGYAPDDRHEQDCHRAPDYRHNDCAPDKSKPNSESAPAQPSNTPDREPSADQNYVIASFVQPAAPASAIAAKDANLQFATDVDRTPSQLRREVRNAILLLRAMPPQARERRINSGKYDSFTPEEWQLIRRALQPSAVK
jgi:hypothetical protein